MIENLFATFALMCAPQADSVVKNSCEMWMARCYFSTTNSNTEDTSAEEICVEKLPEELWPRK